MREGVRTVREMKQLGDNAGVAAWEEVARAVQRQKYRAKRQVDAAEGIDKMLVVVPVCA